MQVSLAPVPTPSAMFHHPAKMLLDTPHLSTLGSPINVVPSTNANTLVEPRNMQYFLICSLRHRNSGGTAHLASGRVSAKAEAVAQDGGVETSPGAPTGQLNALPQGSLRSVFVSGPQSTAPYAHLLLTRPPNHGPQQPLGRGPRLPSLVLPMWAFPLQSLLWGSEPRAPSPQNPNPNCTQTKLTRQLSDLLLLRSPPWHRGEWYHQRLGGKDSRLSMSLPPLRYRWPRPLVSWESVPCVPPPAPPCSPVVPCPGGCPGHLSETLTPAHPPPWLGENN